GKPAKYNRKPIKTDVYLWNTEKPYTYSAYFTDEDFGKIIFKKTRSFEKEEELTIDSKVHKVLFMTDVMVGDTKVKARRYSVII
ncbi:hypothetical protein, partial [Klebsiella pneumoniae]|uniref:hypothetical protein n=1 Tax=Klebsiella pneumoniae TaxID=573 RepID=UPI00190F4B17